MTWSFVRPGDSMGSVREFGTNNLPDCSNMCHEASGRALTAALGSGKGTVDLHDWETADAMQSEQPVTKHLVVEVTASTQAEYVGAA